MLGAGAVLYFFNPSTHGFYPVCEFHQLTGLNCPGCGGTRAVYQLLHGHLLRALEDNALVVLSLAGLAGRGAWFETKKFCAARPGRFCRRNFCGRCWSLPWFSRCCEICRHFHFFRRKVQRGRRSANCHARANSGPVPFFAFAGTRSRVQSLNYESDTSIDDHDV